MSRDSVAGCFGERSAGAARQRVTDHHSPAGPATETPITAYRDRWSGREDLNLRPLGPHPSALPGCATPRPHEGPETAPPGGVGSTRVWLLYARGAGDASVGSGLVLPELVGLTEAIEGALLVTGNLSEAMRTSTPSHDPATPLLFRRRLGAMGADVLSPRPLRLPARLRCRSSPSLWPGLRPVWRPLRGG